MQKKVLNDKEFNESKTGKEINKRLKRVFVIGVLCILFGLIYLITNIVLKEEWYEYITPVLLFIFGPIFIYNSFSIRRSRVNEFNYYNKYHNKK